MIEVHYRYSPCFGKVANAGRYLCDLIARYRGQQRVYALDQRSAHCVACISKALEQKFAQICLAGYPRTVYSFQGKQFTESKNGILFPCPPTCCFRVVCDLTHPGVFPTAVMYPVKPAQNVENFQKAIENAFKPLSQPTEAAKWQAACADWEVKYNALKQIMNQDGDTIKQLQETIKQLHGKILDLNNELAPYRAIKLITDSQDLDDAQKRFKLLELD